MAWRVFTEKMGTWWPLGDYKIGKAKAVCKVADDIVSEAQVTFMIRDA